MKQYTKNKSRLPVLLKRWDIRHGWLFLILAKQDSCFFGDIHEELPIAKATVSQHLKELKDAGLIQEK